LLVLAGGSFEPFVKDVDRLKLNDHVVVREKVFDIEEYLQASDVGLFTSESESFGLSILEAMFFGCPSVARRVGGIPEVVEDNVSGILVHSDNPDALANELNGLIRDPARRAAMGLAAQRRAREHFSAEAIVPRYESLYRRLCAKI
jgi:glycosyltransferase involved in cell wall biosynthesis